MKMPTSSGFSAGGSLWNAGGVALEGGAASTAPLAVAVAREVHVAKSAQARAGMRLSVGRLGSCGSDMMGGRSGRAWGIAQAAGGGQRAVDVQGRSSGRHMDTYVHV